MIDPNFQPPAPEISRIETEKREALLPWLDEYFSATMDSILVCGSLSYGANYSVTPKSDIDVQLIINDSRLEELSLLDLYDKEELKHAIAGYKEGIYKQFSLTGEKNGIPIESHFWNKDAFVQAITFVSQETPRLRSSIDTPSTDFGFSFDGSSDSVDFYGEMISNYPVSVFPSYREKGTTLYLCRPVTNILGGPIVIKASKEIEAAMDECWTHVISHLKKARESSDSPESLNVVNALPSQYKMSQTSKAAVIAKTDYILSSSGQ